MPFTDEDLRRLEGHMGGWYLDNGTLTALLARLDAAEAVLDNGVALTHSEDCDKIEHRDLDCTCGSEQRWEVWRKAAGKDK